MGDGEREEQHALNVRVSDKRYNRRALAETLDHDITV